MFCVRGLHQLHQIFPNGKIEMSTKFVSTKFGSLATRGQMWRCIVEIQNSVKKSSKTYPTPFLPSLVWGVEFVGIWVWPNHPQRFCAENSLNWCKWQQFPTIIDKSRITYDSFWSAANGGLRDGGLSKSEDIWGRRPFSSVFWISQVLSAPSGKRWKRQKKGENGRFRPISRKGGQAPLKPPFVTPPFAASHSLRADGLTKTLSGEGLLDHEKMSQHRF